MDWKRKFCSRKFWAALAAMLASIGATISGLHSDNTIVIVIGIACTAFSAAAYAVAEAIADAGNGVITVEHYGLDDPPTDGGDDPAE